jgi:hypothetical protein
MQRLPGVVEDGATDNDDDLVDWIGDRRDDGDQKQPRDAVPEERG